MQAWQPQLQDLLRHSIPDGDPPRIIDRAPRLLLEDVLRQKGVMTKRERHGAQVSSDHFSKNFASFADTSV